MRHFYDFYRLCFDAVAIFGRLLLFPLTSLLVCCPLLPQKLSLAAASLPPLSFRLSLWDFLESSNPLETSVCCIIMQGQFRPPSSLYSSYSIYTFPNHETWIIVWRNSLILTFTVEGRGLIYVNALLSFLSIYTGQSIECTSVFSTIMQFDYHGLLVWLFLVCWKMISSCCISTLNTKIEG